MTRGLAALAGFFDAAGFLAFGRVYVVSPVANTTILGVELAGMQAFQLAGTALLSFLVGVILTRLCTHGLVHWRRTAVSSGVAAAVCIGFLFLGAGDICPSLVPLASAAGRLHCVLERDPQHLQEGMFPCADDPFGRCILDFAMTEEDLDGTKVADRLADDRRLCSKGVRAILASHQTELLSPIHR